MTTTELVRDGVLAIPLLDYANGIATIMVIGPLAENTNKEGERCLLIPDSVMEPLVGKKEFPGGGVKVNESLEQGLMRELGVETEIDPSADVLERMKFIFEDVPIDQLRPNLTHFKVSAALWFVNEAESAALVEKGAQIVLLDVTNGNLFRESDMESITLRPAHRDIIKYVCWIAQSLAMTGEKVLQYETVIDD